ncbi:hypothetical protein [Sulfuricystis multivorans]|uniref:hypothetical protein n=1 Tax=Sulfuricystis multivorans TaxID=2211108 RepID=UPI000F84679B|nr:hypothetical protein [Sulfuricystis multivorans]
MIQAIRHREETINTQLAIVLSKLGVNADAETIHRHGQQRPDVMFLLGGVRVVIEGKYEDVPDAENTVLRDARQRVQSGICHIAVALIYPKTLRAVRVGDLEAALSKSRLRHLVISETGETDWAEGSPDEVLASLRRAHEAMTKDDIVAASAERLSQRIQSIADLWAGAGGVCDKLSDVLGMPPRRGETADERDGRRETAAKVAALVLANAMIFQEQLAATNADGRIDSLRAYDNAADPINEIKAHWRWIWTRINYVPIFQIGEAILEEVPITQGAIAAVRWLKDEAKAICANQSALRHDLMGRIYHWLLHHAKYLGTYYTATSSATMLLKLTFAQKWDIDFGSLKKLVDFVAADLACGTGTLLMATAQAITDRFIVDRVSSGRKIEQTDLKHLHETLMENIIYGYDVLPSAVHLTASTLGMLAPEVTYRRMNLFTMPMGVQGRTLRLGSLDFIGHRTVPTQFTLDYSQMEVKQTGVVSEHYTKAEVPVLDLCVMNPPFVRSVGGNLLFGSLPDDERDKLQAELKRRAQNLKASITAGLGSVFMAIADKHLRAGGRMAFILPAALATGEAWGESRRLIADGYHLEVVIVSHDAERPNFSENTDLSELMFVARKLKRNETPGRTLYVNLWHNPATIYEAMDMTSRIVGTRAADVESGAVAPITGSDGRKLAEIVSLPAAQGEEQWIGVQFAQTWTLRVAVQLLRDKVLAVPGSQPVTVPLCRVSEIGGLGNDQRDIHDAFELSDWSPYPAFWNHDAKSVLSIAQRPNAFLAPRTTPAKGRTKIKNQESVWGKAGRILLVERVRTNSHRVLAVGFEQAVLGNTWWALKANLAAEQEKALLLWLNSTPSLLLMLSRRVVTQGAWMKIKKPQWEAMPVLDVRNLADNALHQLADAYDRLSGQELQALARLNVDPVRAEIDAAISAALHLPDMKALRELLAREPGLTGKGISFKPGQTGLFGKDELPGTHPVQIELL